jgi:DNA-binding NtrC family response regulator
LKPTILVAEDEHAARLSLAELLKADGCSVFQAEDGEQALSLVLHGEPDVALLDIRMPKMDGLEVLRRALHGGSKTAFLVMTAYGDSNTAIQAMKLGAFDYLVKPIDFGQVRTQIERAMEHLRLTPAPVPYIGGIRRTGDDRPQPRHAACL